MRSAKGWMHKGFHGRINYGQRTSKTVAEDDYICRLCRTRFLFFRIPAGLQRARAVVLRSVKRSLSKYYFRTVLFFVSRACDAGIGFCSGWLGDSQLVGRLGPAGMEADLRAIFHLFATGFRRAAVNQIFSRLNRQSESNSVV